MQRAAAVATCILCAGLFLSGGSAAGEWSGKSPGALGGAVGTGAYVFLPYLVPIQDVSAEIVVANRFAIGGKALFPFGQPSDVLFLPFIAVGTARSRPTAAYLAATWLPGSTGGTLGLGYEAALRGPVRLYGELGVLGSIDELDGLPYGHFGVRLRF